MKKRFVLLRATVAALAFLAMAACVPNGTFSPVEVAEAAKDLRALVPAIEAGLALAKPDMPSARALSPDGTLRTSGVANPWTYGAQTPAQVYAAAGGTTRTLRLPASGYYETTAGDELYFALTPVGTTYYRLVLYTYPAFDLVVAYTIEEYIVNSAGTESWAWGNLDSSHNRDSWVGLTTVYIDGTSGSRTLQWASGTSGLYYDAFDVGEPDPKDTASFRGYRYEESEDPPGASAGASNYSSNVTEAIKGKGASIDASQYYTESSATAHSGLTYVFNDKKNKKLSDTHIVTRMQEDTVAGTRKIRSVGEIGVIQYYIDRVDIGLASGAITYSSTHDVYDTALPRGGDPGAKDYVFLSLVEDAPDAGTFTGSMEETRGSERIVQDVAIERDSHYRLAIRLTYKSSAARALADEVSIPLTEMDISNLSIPLPGVSGTFEGYYEAGTLYGSITSGARSYDVVVAEEGVVLEDELYAY